MTFAEYLTDYLIELGVTDMFGVPGGVLLDFLYAVEKRKDKISLHLCGHEQAAGFAAVGYAQMTGKLCVAYGTRGPGFTNLMTAIGDAYFDSIPVLFISAHAKTYTKTARRMLEEQEFDTITSVLPITKKAVRIENHCDIQEKVKKTIQKATRDCPGPVFLDILASLFTEKVENIGEVTVFENKFVHEKYVQSIVESMQQAKRPVFLSGAGIRQCGMGELFSSIINKFRIPVVSSFLGLDTVSASDLYFGYIGSHGERCANHVLNEADLIISCGNRMCFNHQSISFSPIANKKIIRIEIDENESENSLPNELFIHADLKTFLPVLHDLSKQNIFHSDWLLYCNKIKSIFDKFDKAYPIDSLLSFFTQLDTIIPIVADVGDNEFFITRAYSLSKIPNRLLMSKSFAALGCSLPKAIGMYYSNKTPVLAFMGDQALLFNIQELHTIVTQKLPIAIIVLNNHASGMIKSQQKLQKRSKFLHTTADSGYSVPDLKKIAEGFGLLYLLYENQENLFKIINNLKSPVLIEFNIGSDIDIPVLPKGNACYDFEPKIKPETLQVINEYRREFYEKSRADCTRTPKTNNKDE